MRFSGYKVVASCQMLGWESRGPEQTWWSSRKRDIYVTNRVKLILRSVETASESLLTGSQPIEVQNCGMFEVVRGII